MLRIARAYCAIYVACLSTTSVPFSLSLLSLRPSFSFSSRCLPSSSLLQSLSPLAYPHSQSIVCVCIPCKFSLAQKTSIWNIAQSDRVEYFSVKLINRSALFCQPNPFRPSTRSATALPCPFTSHYKYIISSNQLAPITVCLHIYVRRCIGKIHEFMISFSYFHGWTIFASLRHHSIFWL